MGWQGRGERGPHFDKLMMMMDPWILKVNQPEKLERSGQVVEASCSVGSHHPHTLLLLVDGTVGIFNLAPHKQ